MFWLIVAGVGLFWAASKAKQAEAKARAPMLSGRPSGITPSTKSSYQPYLDTSRED